MCVDVPRSVAALVAILAANSAGAAFAPLDPGQELLPSAWSDASAAAHQMHHSTCAASSWRTAVLRPSFVMQALTECEGYGVERAQSPQLWSQAQQLCATMKAAPAIVPIDLNALLAKGPTGGFAAAHTRELKAASSSSAGMDEAKDDSAADEDAPVCVLYTSGSTGRPKGVLCSRRCVSSCYAVHRSALMRTTCVAEDWRTACAGSCVRFRLRVAR